MHWGLKVCLSSQPWDMRTGLSAQLDVNDLVPFFSCRFVQAGRKKKRREH